jgi:hypothetical protein
MTIMIMIPRVKGFRTSQDLAGTLNQRNRGPNQKRTKKKRIFFICCRVRLFDFLLNLDLWAFATWARNHFFDIRPSCPNLIGLNISRVTLIF